MRPAQVIRGHRPGYGPSAITSAEPRQTLTCSERRFGVKAKEGGQLVSKFQGFSTLATPADLLEKLRHDLSRIRQNLTHPYAAFDFFVTAEHLLDWKYPDTVGQSNKNTRTLLRTTTPLLRVVSHLANGAKHFKATRHKSVDSVRPHSGFFDPEFFDPGFFDTDSLRVELIGDDALALGPEITVLALAQQVLQYWEANLASP